LCKASGSLFCNVFIADGDWVKKFLIMRIIGLMLAGNGLHAMVHSGLPGGNHARPESIEARVIKTMTLPRMVFTETLDGTVNVEIGRLQILSATISQEQAKRLVANAGGDWSGEVPESAFAPRASSPPSSDLESSGSEINAEQSQQASAASRSSRAPSAASPDAGNGLQQSARVDFETELQKRSASSINQIRSEVAQSREEWQKRQKPKRDLAPVLELTAAAIVLGAVGTYGAAECLSAGLSELEIAERAKRLRQMSTFAWAFSLGLGEVTGRLKEGSLIGLGFMTLGGITSLWMDKKVSDAEKQRNLSLRRYEMEIQQRESLLQELKKFVPELSEELDCMNLKQLHEAHNNARENLGRELNEFFAGKVNQRAVKNSTLSELDTLVQGIKMERMAQMRTAMLNDFATFLAPGASAEMVAELMAGLESFDFEKLNQKHNEMQLVLAQQVVENFKKMGQPVNVGMYSQLQNVGLVGLQQTIDQQQHALSLNEKEDEEKDEENDEVDESENDEAHS
jgi:hypothetical protein